MIEYQKVLDRNAFGNFRTLLRDVTLSPAMGNYLDMARSTRFSPGNDNVYRFAVRDGDGWRYIDCESTLAVRDLQNRL